MPVRTGSAAKPVRRAARPAGTRLPAVTARPAITTGQAGTHTGGTSTARTPGTSMTPRTAGTTCTTQRPVIDPTSPARTPGTAVTAGEPVLPGHRLRYPRNTIAARTARTANPAATIDRQRLPIRATRPAITAVPGIDTGRTRTPGTPGPPGTTATATRGAISPARPAVAAISAQTTRTPGSTGPARTPPARRPARTTITAGHPIQRRAVASTALTAAAIQPPPRPTITTIWIRRCPPTPLAPLPTNGRPDAAATGENTANRCAPDTTAASGDAYAASAAAYAWPAPVNRPTNPA